MFKKIVLFLAISLVLVAPMLSLAAPVDFGTPPTVQTAPNNANFIGTFLGKILDLIWIIFIAYAIIMFLVAGFFFLKAQGEPAELATAKKFLLWGAIGVAVAVAAFTIPFFIRNTISPVVTCSPVCQPGTECMNGICLSIGGPIN